jgi:large conductance mechanosensitive channel
VTLNLLPPTDDPRTGKQGMLKGFKDFISRGNIVELAVAVVIGTAFTAIVTAFTRGIIKPFINALGGSNAAQGLGFRVLPANPSTFVDIGTLINTVIDFLLVAAVVYFVFVLPMNTLRERRKRGQEPGPAEPTDVELLTEIRDLLKHGQQRDGSRPQASSDRAPSDRAPSDRAPSDRAPARDGD